MSLGFLALIVFSVLFWIGEVRGRQKLELALTSQIASFQEKLSNGAQQPDSPIKKQLAEYNEQLSRLQTLTVSGTDHDETTLGQIRNDVFYLIEATSTPSSTNQPPKEDEGERKPVVWFCLFFLPRYMPSDQLLSLVVIMSGAIGAVVAALRATRALSLADLGFGIAAGFITLLAIRGGKNVFMVSNEDFSFYLNPYSSAFAGLLAGLFTDKAYALLRKFVEKLVDGIEDSFHLEKDSAEDGSPTVDDKQPASNPSSDSTTPAATPTTSDPTAEKQPDGKPTDSSED